MPGPRSQLSALVLYGPPASGKSTLWEVFESGHYRLGASDLIRARCQTDPGFARYAEPVMASGRLIEPLKLIECVTLAWPSVPLVDLFVDGVTRTYEQVTAMMEMLRERQYNILSLHLKVPKAVARERNEKQRREQRRTDSDRFEERWAEYERHCPIVSGLLPRFGPYQEIDGDRPKEEIVAEVRGLRVLAA